MKSTLNTLAAFLLTGTLMLGALGLWFNHPGAEERRLTTSLNELYQNASQYPDSIQVEESERQPLTQQRLIFRTISWIGFGASAVFTLLSFTLAQRSKI